MNGKKIDSMKENKKRSFLEKCGKWVAILMVYWIQSADIWSLHGIYGWFITSVTWTQKMSKFSVGL